MLPASRSSLSHNEALAIVYRSALLDRKVGCASTGVKDRVAQEMLRHTQYSTTASIYQHVARDDHFAAAQAVQNWIERALG